MRRLWILVLATACTREPELAEPTEPSPPAVAPVPDAAPRAPLLLRIEHVPTYGLVTQLCLHDTTGATDCLGLRYDHHVKGLTRTVAAHDRTATARELTRGRTRCQLDMTTLACDGEPPVAIEHHGNTHYGYVRYGDTIEWTEFVFDDSHPEFGAGTKLHRMRPIPGGVRQLAAGFRAACVLTRDDAVYCWSDPRRPARKLATPPQIADIAIVDPFELCVRTTAGAVACTPAFGDDELACDKRSHRCGTWKDRPNATGYGDGYVTGWYDPLAKIRRPLADLAIAHGAHSLVVAENQPHAACRGEHLEYDAGSPGACAIGDAGEVSCFRPCDGAWSVARIAVPPARQVWADAARGYAVTAGGDLYTWPSACGDQAPTRLPVQGVTEVTAQFHVITGPHAYAPMRCAIVDHGAGARCWRVDGDTIAQLADPRTLPLATTRR